EILKTLCFLSEGESSMLFASWRTWIRFRKSTGEASGRRLQGRKRALALEPLEDRLAPALLQAVSLANPALDAMSAGAQSVDGVSDDGRYVAFESSSSNVVAGDSNNASDIFVRDLQAGTTTLASVTSAGASGNGASQHTVMTSDGRYVAFDSY